MSGITGIAKLALVAAAVASALSIFSPAAARAEGFTLEQAVKYALDHNKSLLAKHEDLPAAEGRVTEAWSGVMPHLTATGGYMWLSEVPTITVPTAPTITTAPVPSVKMNFQDKKMGASDNTKADLQLTQVLFTSGALASGIKAAKAAKAAADEGVMAQEDSLARQTAEAYYAVLLAQDVFEARKDQLEVSEAHLAAVRENYKFGAASRYEVLRAELDVNNIKPQVKQADNNVKIAKTGLKSFMGYDLDGAVEVFGTLEEQAVALTYPEALAAAEKNRHELAGLDRAMEAQRNGTWAATAGMLPKIAAVGDYTYQKPWYFENDWQGVWSVGINVSIPVFDGLSAWGKRNTSAAQERQLRKQKNAAVEGIDLEIRKALLDLTEIRERVASTRENVERSKEVYKMIEGTYKQGAATNIEVMDAELAMTGARTQHLQALYDFQIARTRLLAAAGKLNGEGVEK